MKRAVVIIDVQRGLFEPLPQPYEADAVISRINELAERARRAHTPVLFVQHERPDSPLAHSKDSWQLDPRLVVVATDACVRKTTPDSFLRTNLRDLLLQWGAEELVICGYASEFCVDTTTRSAAALGFAVTLASDAHTTHDKGHASAAQIRAHHNATLPHLRSFGPRIDAVPAREIFFDG